VRGQAVERLCDLLVHLHGEAVQPIGAVEREARNAGGGVKQDRLVTHTRLALRLLERGYSGSGDGCNSMTAEEDALARRVAETLLAREGTGPAWGIILEEARQGYACVSMMVRADMLNGHGICHGGMIFALADTAFAYACNSRNDSTVAQGASITFLASAKEG